MEVSYVLPLSWATPWEASKSVRRNGASLYPIAQTGQVDRDLALWIFEFLNHSLCVEKTMSEKLMCSPGAVKLGQDIYPLKLLPTIPVDLAIRDLDLR